MERFRYLIVGGGMTGDAAVRGIRESDPGGTIGIIGAETEMPYKRPPLSKGLWKGDPEETIWYWTESRGDRVNYFRTFADYNRLRELVSQGKRIAVIGAGFIGMELAAA